MVIIVPPLCNLFRIFKACSIVWFVKWTIICDTHSYLIDQMLAFNFWDLWEHWGWLDHSFRRCCCHALWLTTLPLTEPPLDTKTNQSTSGTIIIQYKQFFRQKSSDAWDDIQKEMYGDYVWKLNPQPLSNYGHLNVFVCIRTFPSGFHPLSMLKANEQLKFQLQTPTLCSR